MAVNAFLKKIQQKDRKIVGTQAGGVAFIKGKAILEVPMDRIDEDPRQPRTSGNEGFSDEAIAGLAESIESNGLLQPISVHEHPTEKGRYVINHGARRFRAVKSLGWKTIPALMDDEYSEQKQLIENLQREDLSLLEIVKSITAIKQNFKKNGDLAKAVGKSNAWVSQMLSLSKLEPEIASLLQTGSCQDTLVLIGLNKLLQTNPDDVARFIEAGQLTRTALDDLKQRLADEEAAKAAAAEAAAHASKEPQADEQHEEAASSDAPDGDAAATGEDAADDETAGFGLQGQSGKEEASPEGDADDFPGGEEADETPQETGTAEEEKAEPAVLSHLVITVDGRRARLVLDRPLLVRFEDGEAKLVKLTAADI